MTHVINCASRQLKNFWESIGVHYLTFPWADNDTQVILDAEDKTADQSYSFIEEAATRGNSILIHSVRGQGRTCTILSAYMMKKYRWSLLKTLEFLNFRIPDLEIREAFVRQLTAYEGRLAAKGLEPKTSKWSEVLDPASAGFENEELLLRNTYLNARMRQFIDFGEKKAAKRALRVKWTDEEEKNVKPLAVIIKDKEFKEEPQVSEKKPRVILLVDTPRMAAGIVTKEDVLRNLSEAKSQEPKQEVKAPQRTPQPNQLSQESAHKIVLQASNETESSDQKPIGNKFAKENNERREQEKQAMAKKSVHDFEARGIQKAEVADLPLNGPQAITKAEPNAIDLQQGVPLALEGQSAIRKIVQAKKARAPLRSISVIVRRKSPSTAVGKRAVLERSANQEKNPGKYAKNLALKGNAKPQHSRGKSLESPQKVMKLGRKVENKGKVAKKRQRVFSKTMNLDSVLKIINESIERQPNMRNNTSPKQLIKPAKTYPVNPAKHNY